MPRKVKIPIQAMEDVRPEPRPMAPPSMSGGAICHICKGEIDRCCDMEGGGYLSKAAEKVEKISRKGASKVKKAGMKVDKYVTDTDGLLSDIVNYGIPATTGAAFGALGSATGNPALGIAASALGSKLGTMASDKIADETMIQSRTGEGLKRKPRFAKGSQEAKDYMKMLREKRQKK